MENPELIQTVYWTGVVLFALIGIVLLRLMEKGPGRHWFWLGFLSTLWPAVLPCLLLYSFCHLALQEAIHGTERASRTPDED